ncbi:MAG: DUF4157 domain-containing protein [Cellvibrio sp.]
MSMKPAAKTASTNKFSPVANSVLQPKCACGNQTAAGGECTNCAAKKLQKKLSIGASNDPLELEADRVADQVLGNQSAHSFSNMAAPKIRRRAVQSSTQADEVPASVERTLSSSGNALPTIARRDMEQRFNQDFSGVRIHTDSNAAQSARDINANAYTAGNNIVFGSGKFSPESQQGKHLLAHELTHVVQQSQSHIADELIQRDPDDQWIEAWKKKHPAQPVMGSKEWLAAFNAKTPEEQKAQEEAKAKLMAQTNPAIAHAAPAPAPDLKKMNENPAKMADFIKAQQEAHQRDEALKAKNKAAEAEKKRRAAAAEEERTSLGPSGSNDKRRALAGSPVLALQQQLEAMFKSKDEIEKFRKQVAKLTPEEFFMAFPGMSADMYLTLHDYGQVGSRNWENFKPPPADIDAIMRRALKLPPDKYLSQSHQDHLANAIVNGKGTTVAKELGISPEELERIAAYFKSTGRAGLYIDKDPLIMAQGYTGRESGYGAFQMRQRLANLEVLANSPFAGVGYGAASAFTDDEQKRMAWAGLGANLEGFATAAAGVGQGRQAMKDAGKSVSTADQIVDIAPNKTGSSGRTPPPATPGGLTEREASVVFGERQAPATGRASLGENSIVIGPALSPPTPISHAKGSRGIPEAFNKVAPGTRPLTNLADKRPQGSKPPSEPAAQSVPQAVQQQEQMAAGQTHGSGQGRAPLSLAPNEQTINSANNPSDRKPVSPIPLLPAGRPTTRTLDQVRATRGGSNKRGAAGKLHQAEISGGNAAEKATATSEGTRFHDVRDEPMTTQTVMRREVKNYSVILTDPQGNRYLSSVRDTQRHRDEALKDKLWMEEGAKLGEFRIVQWDFLGAPPTPELAALLRSYKIPYTESPSIGTQMMTPKKK